MKLKSNSSVIDLSYNRKKELIWLGQHPIDKELLFECAYYPKPPAFGMRVSGCSKCSFDKPLKSCPYSHILDFSGVKSKNKIDRATLRLIEQLSEDDREALVEMLKGRR